MMGMESWKEENLGKSGEPRQRQFPRFSASLRFTCAIYCPHVQHTYMIHDVSCMKRRFITCLSVKCHLLNELPYLDLKLEARASQPISYLVTSALPAPFIGSLAIVMIFFKMQSNLL